MQIDIIIPVYHGEKTIKRIVDELVSHLNYEQLKIILINDGSTDDSNKACLSIFKSHKNMVKYIRLTRNFGEHNAVLAGLNHSFGDYAVIIDDDFQNPPEEIKKLINKAIEGGFDVVYSYYQKKHHAFYRNLGSKFNNFIATCLLNKPRDLYLSSFKCINRFMINEIIKYKGPFPYIDGLILRVTHNIGKVLVRHERRKSGKSGYNINKLIHLWLNMFVNFSISPLRVSTFLGFLFSVLGAVFAVYTAIDKIIHPQIPVGFTSTMVAILVFSGIQLIMLGLIGEYIGKQLLSSNQTPQYVIREIFSEDEQ
mgnify:FL=1